MVLKLCKTIGVKYSTVVEQAYKAVSALLFVLAEEGVGRGWGTGDCPPELMLTASRGRPEVDPIPIPAERVVLPMTLAERVDPRNALLLAAPYSASASPSRSSALKACCRGKTTLQGMIQQKQH